MNLVDIVVDIVVSGSCYAFGLLAARRKAAGPVQPTRAKCTGYRVGHGVVHKIKRDCHALGNPSCLDGRCFYHCSQMCKCCTPEGLR